MALTFKCVRGGKIIAPDVPGTPGPPGADGGAVALLYAVDFSTLPAANLLTGGDATKTIDGKAAWALKGSAKAQAVALNDGTHAGLYIRDATVASDYNGATIDGPRFFVGLSDLTGRKWQELNEIFAMVMFSQPHTPNANYQGARIGVKVIPDAAENGISYHAVRAYVNGLVDIVEIRSGNSSANLSTVYNGFTVPAITDDVIAFRILNNVFLEIYSGASVEGAFPAVSALKLSALCQFAGFNSGAQTYQPNLLNIASGASASLQFALMFICSASGDASGESDLLIKKLQILGR